MAQELIYMAILNHAGSFSILDVFLKILKKEVYNVFRDRLQAVFFV